MFALCPRASLLRITTLIFFLHWFHMLLHHSENLNHSFNDIIIYRGLFKLKSFRDHFRFKVLCFLFFWPLPFETDASIYFTQSQFTVLVSQYFSHDKVFLPPYLFLQTTVLLWKPHLSFFPWSFLPHQRLTMLLLQSGLRLYVFALAEVMGAWAVSQQGRGRESAIRARGVLVVMDCGCDWAKAWHWMVSQQSFAHLRLLKLS